MDTTTQKNQQKPAKQTTAEFTRLMDAATAALETIANHQQDGPGDEGYESAARCANHTANLWEALMEHARKDPQAALIAAQGRQDCLEAAQPASTRGRGVASTKEFLAEQIARATVAWANHIAATLRGRNCDLLLHVTESQRQIAIWAEELDPNEPPYDPSANIFWMTPKPDGIDERIRRQYHPKAASIDHIAWALRLQHASYNPGQVEVKTQDGSRKAPAVVLTEGEARQRLADATAPNADVTVRMSLEAARWLNGQ